MSKRLNGLHLPRLSVPEWQIFHIYAKTGPGTVRDIISRLKPLFPHQEFVYATVLTYTQRLVEKGYLRQLPTKRARANQYEAAAGYQAALRLHLEHFLSGFAITAEDLATLREILDDLPKPPR